MADWPPCGHTPNEVEPTTFIEYICILYKYVTYVLHITPSITELFLLLGRVPAKHSTRHAKSLFHKVEISLKSFTLQKRRQLGFYF